MSATVTVPRLDLDGWRAPEPPPSLDLDQLASSLRHGTTPLPSMALDRLRRFGQDPGPLGVLLLTGLDFGPTPDTPSDPAAVTTQPGRTEHTLLSVGAVLGEPVGYLPELGGRLIQDLCPVPAASDRQTSTSSRSTLMFHTEAAFHPHRPSYLLLACRRADHEGVAATTFTALADVLGDLDDDTVAVLRSPRFRLFPDESYLDGKPGRWTAPVPVLRVEAGRTSLVFDADLLRPEDAEAATALETLRHAVDHRQQAIFLRPGDLLVIDNDVVVHGRSPFPARFDGRDRWLQRAFVVSPDRFEAAERVGRIVTTTFSD
ncbi:MAG: TauD/TfdA family dioxygenase [Ilumatobacteraceae bacterium]